MTLNRPWIILIILLVCLASFAFSATERPVPKFSDGRDIPSDITVIATIQGSIATNDSETPNRCTFDFLSSGPTSICNSNGIKNVNGCSYFCSNGNGGVLARPGSYVDFSVRITNNSDSVITAGAPYMGGTSYSIGYASGFSATADYSFSTAVPKADPVNPYQSNCNWTDTTLERGETFVGNCRLIVTNDLPDYRNNYGSTARAWYFLGMNSHTNLGVITVKPEWYYGQRFNNIIPLTAGEGGSVKVERVGPTNSDYSSPLIPLTFDFKTQSDQTPAQLESFFNRRVTNVALSGGANGIANLPCSITQPGSSKRDFRIVCNSQNDWFNASSPQTVLPSPYNYMQVILSRDAALNTNNYRGATTIANGNGNLFTLQNFFTNYDRFPPAPYVSSSLVDKRIFVSSFRAYSTGSLYLDRSEDVRVQAQFYSRHKNQNYISKSDSAYSKIKIQLFAIPAGANHKEFIQNNAPIYDADFDASKVVSENAGQYSFTYEFGLPPSALNNLTGSYDLFIALMDKDKLVNGRTKAFMMGTATPGKFIRFFQPADDPFWNSSSRYDRLYNTIRHPIGLRNLFLGSNGDLTISVVSGDASKVRFYESSSSYCSLPALGHTTGTYNTTLTPRIPGDPPSVNKWICLDANSGTTTASDYTLRATLCRSGSSSCITEDLLIRSNPKPNVFFPTAPLNAYASPVHALRFTVGSSQSFAFKNIIGSTSGGLSGDGTYAAGSIEGGQTNLEIKNPYLAVTRYTESECSITYIPGLGELYSCSGGVLCDAATNCGAQYSLNGTNFSNLEGVLDVIDLFTLSHTQFSSRSQENPVTGNTNLDFTRNVSLKFNQEGIFGISNGICDGIGNCISGMQLVNVTPLTYDSSCTWTLRNASNQVVATSATASSSVNLNKDATYHLDLDLENEGLNSWTPLWNGTGYPTGGTFLLGAGNGSTGSDSLTPIGVTQPARLRFTNSGGVVTPGTVRPARYTFTPTQVGSDTIIWRMLQEWVDSSNSTGAVGWFGESCQVPVNVRIERPATCTVSATPSTVDVSENSNVELTCFNSSGNEISCNVDGVDLWVSPTSGVSFTVPSTNATTATFSSSIEGTYTVNGQVHWYGSLGMPIPVFCSPATIIVDSPLPPMTCVVDPATQTIKTGENPSFTLRYENKPPTTASILTDSSIEACSISCPVTSSGSGSCTVTCGPLYNSSENPVNWPFTATLFAQNASGLNIMTASCPEVNVTVNPDDSTPPVEGLPGDVVSVSTVVARDMEFDDEKLADINGLFALTYFLGAVIGEDQYKIELLKSDGTVYKIGTILPESAGCLNTIGSTTAQVRTCRYQFTDVNEGSYRVRVSIDPLSYLDSEGNTVPETFLANNIAWSNPFLVNAKNPLNIPDAPPYAAVVIALALVSVILYTRRR